MRVKCLAQEHNTVSPARAQTQTTHSGVERINHEDTLLMPIGDWINEVPLLVGSRDGTVVRALASDQCGPGSIPRPDIICRLSLLLDFSSLLRGFSPGSPVFLPSLKQTLLNSNLIWKQWMKSHFVEMPLQISIIIVIIYIVKPGTKCQLGKPHRLFMYARGQT